VVFLIRVICLTKPITATDPTAEHEKAPEREGRLRAIGDQPRGINGCGKRHPPIRAPTLEGHEAGEQATDRRHQRALPTRPHHEVNGGFGSSSQAADVQLSIKRVPNLIPS